MKNTLLPLLLAAGGAAAAAPRAPVDLQHIALDLRLDWAAQSALGTATLTLTPLKPTRRVQLDGAALKIESITLAGQPLSYRYDGSARDGALDIALPAEAPAGQPLTLRIAYRTGWVNHSDPGNIWGSNGLGLRWFSPTMTDPRKRRQVWASGEPRSARYWFPGIDDPADWRTAELNATVDAPLQVQAAGELLSVRSNPDGTRSYHWRADRAHSNQRTLFIVGEYAELPQAHPGARLNNLGYPQEMDGVAASVPRLPDVVDFFSELLGQPLPGGGLRQVFVPDLPWGAAAPGLAMQSENMVDDTGTHADYFYLWNVLQAENTALQWWPTPAGWRDTWLERGMARHLGGLYTQHRNGEPEFQLYTHQADHDALLLDWASGIREPLVPKAEPDAAFLAGNRPYLRGGAVLNLLRSEVGDEAWRRVLRELSARAGPISRRDLERACERAAGRPMAWFFQQWLHRPSHPVFEVSLRGQVLRVEQKQSDGYFAGHVDLDLDGKAERVWLRAQARNEFRLPPARLIHFDRGSAWLKQLRFDKPTTVLLEQLRATDDTRGRHWAQTQLVQRAQDKATPSPERETILAGLRELAARPDLYWRVRTNALAALRSLVAPGLPAAVLPAAPIDEATTALLLKLIQEERSWVRATAIAFLGMAHDPAHALLFESLLRDPSDRVITMAALALGKTASPLAFEALRDLPAHPSWKNQTLIAALGGLAQLGDPRGIQIALTALNDTQGDRWTLATPVWDYRLAAADTLRALGAGARGVALLHAHLADALASGHVNDSFYNLQLLVALGVPEARQALAQVRKRFSTDPQAVQAVKGQEQQLEAYLKR